MPITSEIDGDLVKLAKSGKYKAIVHGANCFCVMGSGIAPQIKAAWPLAYEADLATTRGDLNKLGDYTVHHDQSIDLRVFNAYTQYSMGGKGPDIDYKAVSQVFQKLNFLIPSIERHRRGVDTRKVGIPLIGAGLAKGDWAAISCIIDLVTPDLEIELVRYKP